MLRFKAKGIAVHTHYLQGRTTRIPAVGKHSRTLLVNITSLHAGIQA
jgi:hypothetical protein